SDKIQRPVRLVFLSDVHSQKFKDGGENLIRLIDEADPDCILLGGDVFDKYADKNADAKTYALLQSIRHKFKNCFFVSGNHEFESGKKEEFLLKLSSSGINILGDESFVFKAQSGQEILIGGVDYDPCDCEKAFVQRDMCAQKAQENGLFSVLVRHVPYFAEGDEKIDLILSGHNHGGLWRFPGSNAGIAGGGRKLFPKFVHGEYNVGNNTTLIVGSGISTSTYLLPRLYNVPEVVKVTLQPLRNF
ncbi:MAG: metallophosphoesterase, partial [Clostridia bacterium]|nr:metallophosphoesterase [Clostridia bacterium]